MIDEGLVFWADSLRDVIRSADPTALVTVGFFTPNFPNQVNGPDEMRLVRTSYFLRNSSMRLRRPPPLSGQRRRRLRHLGELRHRRRRVACRSSWVSTGRSATGMPATAAGAAAVMGLEVEACRVGFDGFLVWAWRGDLADDIFWATDGAGEVAAVLSPINRPDPCEYGQFDFIEFNWAARPTAPRAARCRGSRLRRRSTASTRIRIQPIWPRNRSSCVSSVLSTHAVDMTVAQSPPGRSVRQVWVRPAGGDLAARDVRGCHR